MTPAEWAMLALALSGLAFVFVLALCIAAAAEDRRMERAHRRRYMDRRTHPTFRDLPNDGWGVPPKRGEYR